MRFTALPRGFTGSFELHATLAPPYEHPRVTVAGDDGSVAHPAVTVDDSGFHASIICTGTTSLINRERISAHLAPLRPDRRMALAAARSARAMKEGNGTASKGTFARRVAEPGGRPRHVVEMTFRAADLARASMRLLNDPVARAQVL